MPDLGPAFGALLDLFGPVIGAALKALLRTVFGMVLLGAAVTCGTVYFAAQGSWVRALVAALLCVAALVAVTGMLAVKNAVMSGLVHGLRKLSLGRKVLTLLFNRLGVSDDSEQGERAGVAGRVVEKLPLREAEARLTSALDGLLAQRASKPGLRGWLFKKLLHAALTRVAKLTLARFRSGDAKESGVDLLLVRNELSQVVDVKLTHMVTSKLNLLNFAAAGLYVVFAVLIAVFLPQLITR